MFRETRQAATNTHGIGKIENGLSCCDCFFMVVLDFDVDDVNASVKVGTTIEQVFAHGVKAAFFTGDDYIGGVFGLLPPFWCFLDPFVAGKHSHQPVCPV